MMPKNTHPRISPACGFKTPLTPISRKVPMSVSKRALVLFALGLFSSHIAHAQSPVTQGIQFNWPFQLKNRYLQSSALILKRRAAQLDVEDRLSWETSGPCGSNTAFT
jgi:hypothetical protein